MRTLAVAALTGFVTLMVAGTASAAPIFSLFFTGTSGAGTTGSDSIAAVNGDVLTVDVVLNPNGEAATTGWDFDLLGTNVTGVSGQECPAGSTLGTLANFAAGSCFVGGGVIGPIQAGVTVSGSDILNYDAGALSAQAYSGGTVWVGRAVFTAGGAGAINLTGLYGFADFSQAPISATATIVPEPGTVGLMGLGLAALGLAGRRRK